MIDGVLLDDDVACIVTHVVVLCLYQSLPSTFYLKLF